MNKIYPHPRLLFFSIVLLLTGLLANTAGWAAKDICLLPSPIDPAALISTAQLQESPERFLFVDMRSRLEYEVLHIAGARHAHVVTLQKSDLQRALAEAAKEGKTVVLYCNGGL